MSFNAYIDNIQIKTGKTPEEIKELAEKAGVFSPTMKASQLVAWLKSELGLGHGHCMALWKYYKDAGYIEAK